jgi:hypothetical protein
VTFATVSGELHDFYAIVRSLWGIGVLRAGELAEPGTHMDARVRTKAPMLKTKIRYDPEAGLFVAFGADREALARLTRLIHGAMADPATLSKAIANANPRRMG